MRWLLVLIVIALAACEPIQAARAVPPEQDMSRGEARALAQRAARQFVAVVDRIEPVAEEECRRATRGVNCDFQIVVDDTPGAAPNAFQTVDANGRPILAFNLALILGAQNADELAFVVGHEASHHIAGHLGQAQQNAALGALIFSGLAALGGGSADAVRNAEQMGASLGARSYSKAFELEADRLGTVIAFRAGFDPVRGAEFFNRLPDPGDSFLGTHPPNAARLEAVRRTAASL